jgi:hypothetical protein
MQKEHRWFFYQQLDSGLQEAYTIWNGIAVEKSS